MSQTFYKEFPNVRYWDPQRARCKSLERRGYTLRTVKSKLKKIEKLEAEASKLRREIKERCSHPVEEQYIHIWDSSMCEWNEHWVDEYHCGLCKVQLYKEKNNR